MPLCDRHSFKSWKDNPQRWLKSFSRGTLLIRPRGVNQPILQPVRSLSTREAHALGQPRLRRQAQQESCSCRAGRYVTQYNRLLSDGGAFLLLQPRGGGVG